MIFSNNAATTLASGITNVATSLTVASGTGSLFPNPTGGQYFYMTLANTGGTVEIVKCTARSTDVFTIVRGQDNTSAVAWNSGDKVEQRVVAADLNNMGQLDSTNTWAQAQTFSGGLSGALTGNVTGNVSGTLTGNVTGNVSGTAATITGVNTISHGGTNNGSLAVTAGGVVYTDGSAFQNVGAGTSGQVLQSNGASAPTWVGGNIGVGQTWTDVTSSRALGTTYTNSTGKPIQLGVTIQFPSASNAVVSYSVNGTVIGTLGDNSGSQPALLLPIQIIIPNGATYAVTTTTGSPSISKWWELR